MHITNSATGSTAIFLNKIIDRRKELWIYEV